MPPHSERNPIQRHAYDLFDEGQVVGRLEWRTEPRAAVGWYVVRPEGTSRLSVERGIDELTLADEVDERTWEVNAELSAVLSTALALDAAERLLHHRPEHASGRFRRLTGRQRFEIYVSDVDTAILLRAVPELALESVSDVAVLAGDLLPEAFELIARRITLLGGRILAVLREGHGREGG